MCWLFSCTSTVSFVFCMSGLNAIEKDTVKILHFDCDFAYFFSFCQVYFKAMFCYLCWILMSVCLLRVHLIMIMKIASLIQLVFSSVAQLCLTLCDFMDCSTPGCPVHHQTQSLHKLMSIEPVIPSSNLILCHPLLLLPPVFLSTGVFWNESALHIRWPKYWSFNYNISPSREHSRLISLGWTGWISLHSKGLSRVFSNTTVQKHQFFGAQLSLKSNAHIHTWLLEKP